MRVVETFNEVEDRVTSFVVVFERGAIDQSALERGEEALAQGALS